MRDKLSPIVSNHSNCVKRQTSVQELIVLDDQNQGIDIRGEYKGTATGLQTGQRHYFWQAI
jgi:hypothetical protein